MGQANKQWFVYLVRCCDGSIYTGITDDIEARLRKHNEGKGAKYTASRRPVKLLYSESHPDRGSALRREAELKSWRKHQKEALLKVGNTSDQ
jgi:predicted GIY-YIG superfamily endonuclease